VRDIDFYFSICMVIALVACVGILTIWAVDTWRRRKTRKAQIAAVYSQREETGLVILAKARVKIPLPESQDDGENGGPGDAVQGPE
jgi:hypothetical protein